MKQREKSLRDHIRVNLRKVMADAKAMERKEADKQAGMEKREREARYIYSNILRKELYTMNIVIKYLIKLD